MSFCATPERVDVELGDVARDRPEHGEATRQARGEGDRGRLPGLELDRREGDVVEHARGETCGDGGLGDGPIKFSRRDPALVQLGTQELGTIDTHTTQAQHLLEEPPRVHLRIGLLLVAQIFEGDLHGRFVEHLDGARPLHRSRFWKIRHASSPLALRRCRAEQSST